MAKTNKFPPHTSSRQTQVGVSVDENLDIKHGANLLIPQRENALDNDNVTAVNLVILGQTVWLDKMLNTNKKARHEQSTQNY
jgi:hypothetical protein